MATEVMSRMTLNISFVTPKALYQSSDFRLTNPVTGERILRRGHKSVLVNRFDWSALVCFMGIAHTGRLDTSDWLGRTVNDVPQGAPISALIDRLLSADAWLQNVRQEIRAHTFSVVANDSPRPSLTIVTSIDNLHAPRDSTVASRLRTQTVRPTSPRVFFTGTPIPYGRNERRALERLAKGDTKEVSTAIASINKRASQALGDRFVSEACVVSFLEPSGRGVSVPYGVENDADDFMPRDVADLMQRHGVTFPRKLGADGQPMPVKMVQMATQRGSGAGMTVMELSGVTEPTVASTPPEEGTVDDSE